MSGLVNPDISESDNMARSCLVSYRTIKQCGSTTATTEQTVTTIKRFMAHALKTFNNCRGALGTRVNPDTIGCVWTGEFDLSVLRVELEIFESGKKKLQIQKSLDTCGQGLRRTFFFFMTENFNGAK